MIISMCVDIKIWGAIKKSLSTGNSARFLRGMILPLTVLFVLFGEKIYLYIQKNKKVKK